jgi:hypothetical protein
MIRNFENKTAVLTGGGSGFGLECARIAARLKMNVVLVDVQQDALDKAEAEIKATGVKVFAKRVDVSNAEQMEALAKDVQTHFGAPHFVFNNAGVGSGGLVWENTVADWQWVLGVNVWGVVHGVRLFTPMMLDAAKKDPTLRWPHREHRQHGRFAHSAQHGRLQRQQTCGGGADRNFVPRFEIGHRSSQCQRFVPLLCTHRHQSKPSQSASRLAPSKSHQEPIDWSGHERQSGEQRQGLCRPNGRDGV